MTDAATDDWARLSGPFVDGHYASLRGLVRTHVIDRHLADHLPPAPLSIVDVGGGAGHQSIPLARRGYEVTIVDPSPSMLQRAREQVAAEHATVRERISFVRCSGQDAPSILDARFGAVLCHGVVMYLDDPDPMLDALVALLDDGAVLSVVAKNADTLACRPALAGDWVGAFAAFEADREINGLGVETRADRIDELSEAFAERGVDPIAWYGVRLFTDGWAPDRPADDPEELVFAVELEASRRDPYRQLSRLFHLVGQRRPE